MPKLMLLSISEKEVNVSVNDGLSVAENTSFELLCESSSKPMPFLYSWIWMGRKYNNASLEVPGLSRFDETKVACYVSNKMIPTSGLHQIGTNNSSLLINILHPPDINQMNDTDVVEGSNVTLTCPVKAGIPNDTRVTWTREDDDNHWSGTLLTIQNVSRTDSMIYTCTVKNTMVMTGGISKEGKNQRNTALNVLYEATIIKFYVSEHDVSDTVTVAENQRIYFVCEMEGNPLPTGEIFNHNQLDIQKYANISAKYASFSATFVATCLHGGVYTCNGINELKKHSEENITLHVTCSPRPDASVQLNTVITTTENVPVVLSFTAIAYPTHINAVWTKLVRTSWITVNESEDISIYQSGLKFELFIQDISKSDFGQYKLRIYNTVGSYEQLFSVEPLGSTTGSGTSSSNTSAFVGVGVGVCITTLIIVGSCFFVYKYLRRRQMCQQNNPRGQTDSSNGSTGYATECDQISMSDLNKTEHMTARIETRTDTESSLQYEKLNDSQTGANQYSQLQDVYVYEQIDGATRDTSVENKERKRDIPEYINIKI
ncbi:neural cell adhesion molecule 2-like [Mercenaria mercenaria]|uniref:neural cell adhesion molecule 2-like n=1 Tax=Mercenaria mercenaria TaxID=6596 RepID=UPI00234E94B6|nr:neural cell adhesion molecule 2-like [Mercenaria mercenaria]